MSSVLPDSLGQPTVLGLQVGRPAEHVTSTGREYATAFWKAPVHEPRWLARTQLEGDEQADLRVHGGADKALLAYAAAHYPGWAAHLGLDELAHGAFGENITVADLVEAQVCIGDVWLLGAAVVQVTQPRQPCWKLNARWDRDDLVAEVERTGRSGWYVRVLTEGLVAPGVSLELLERPHPDWTIERANDLMHHRRHDAALAAELAAVPPLSDSWRRTLSARAARGGTTDTGATADTAERTEGPQT
jgi:MOSC domain-containing protein YiiM